MVRTRSAAGGGVVVEIPADRVPGWVNRFSGRNDGLASIEATASAVTLTAGDGTSAELLVPFAPMSVGDREPIEALLDHVKGIAAVGILAARAGAHSVGVVRHGVVVASKTDRAYVQGRTAAGGWSQQRYARRRGNQLTASLNDAADDAAKVLLPVVSQLNAIVFAGDAVALDRIRADSRLEALRGLPSRTFGDVPEPRRNLLDELAERVLAVEIVVRSGIGGGMLA
jgi:hypothetical protein